MSDFKDSEFYKELPEDVKGQLENCNSEEEVMDVLKDHMIAIPDDLMDNVAGGVSWKCIKKSACDDHCNCVGS
jgi:hypothetical protein